MTDTERLDFLQGMLNQKRYTGWCECRWSTTGRGMRLHEKTSGEGFRSIREAIDYMYYQELIEKQAGN
jgi:hypothetical protein